MFFYKLKVIDFEKVMVMKMNIDEILIEETCTIVDAMEKLNQFSTKILYLVEDNKLRATVTDGDIRRWLLVKGSVNDLVSKVANYSPKISTNPRYEDAVQFMKNHNIESVPIVNEDNEIQKIYFLNNKIVRVLNRKINAPVVIMAGGEGKRLYPYTNILPKPLIPIGEQPILQHVINQFSDYGCHQYYIVVNHKKNMIKAYFGEMELGQDIQFVDEDIPLGTGGGLALLKGVINETFILSNCDILIEENIPKIYEQHKSRKNMVTMVCAKKDFVIPYGIVEVNELNEMKSMREKPELSFLTNTGCYIVESELLNYIDEKEFVGFPEVIERCKKDGKKIGVYSISEEAWLDMGQLDELEKMKQRLQIEG